MLLDHLRHSIAAVHSPKALQPFRSAVWRALEENRLTDEQAQELAEAIEARAQGFQRPAWPVPLPSQRAARVVPPPAPAPSSPDRAVSIERRRVVSSEGWMPPELARHFTQGERAALAVVARETIGRGACVLFVDAIGAFSGACRSLVKRALAKAAVLGLVSRAERRVSGDRNDASLVQITSPQWARWLWRRRRGRAKPKGGGGATNVATTCNPVSSKRSKPTSGSLAPAVGGGAAPQSGLRGAGGTLTAQTGPIPSRWTRLRGLEPTGP